MKTRNWLILGAVLAVVAVAGIAARADILLFSDGFDTTANSTGIEYQYTTRQAGSISPLNYEELPETKYGQSRDVNTQITIW